MKMTGWVLAGIDQGIQTLHRQTGASEAQQRARRRCQPEGGDESIRLHPGDRWQLVSDIKNLVSDHYDNTAMEEQARSFLGRPGEEKECVG